MSLCAILIKVPYQIRDSLRNKEGKILESHQKNSQSNGTKRTVVKSALRIVGDDFEPGQISELLQVSPGRTWKKGDEIRDTGHTHPFSAWIYETDASESLSLTYLAKQLQNVFMPKVGPLNSLKKALDLDLCIDFVVVIEDGTPPSMHLDAEFLDFVVRIGAEIDIDTYVN